MPLPANWTTVPVTWTIIGHDGTPAKGVVRFTSAQVVTADGGTYVPAPITARVTDGVMESVNLPTTDDPDISPTGWTWRVQPLTSPDGPEAFNILVPAAGGPINLATVVPASSPTPLSAVAIGDQFVAGRVNDATSATRTALDGQYVRDDELDTGTAANVTGPSQTRTALDAAYAGKDDTTDGLSQVDASQAFFIPASALANGAGAPTLGIVSSRIQAWTLPDSGTPRLLAALRMPREATALDIDLVWINPTSANSGDVKITTYYNRGGIGDNISTVTSLGTATIAVSANTEIRRAPLARGLQIDRGGFPVVMVDRASADAGDTLAGGFGVIGLLVTPTDRRFPELASDAGWCWFNEPRLLADQPRDKMYASWVASNGDIGVSSLGVTTGATASFTLHARLEQDDHDVPGMAVLPDGNLIAFYSKHSVVDAPIYWRKTATPGDISTFGAEQTITLPAGDQPCYPKPAQVGTRLYVFFRNLTNQDFIYSDDNGATWSPPAPLFVWNTGWRGYVNMVRNGDRVDFLVNEDNPNASSNIHLFHCYFSGGNLYKTDGTLIEALIGGGGITTAQMTKVYDRGSDVDADGTADGDPWGWDIQLDGSGNPVAVFATFPGSSTASSADTNHQYRYARWTGSAWSVSEITDAGGTIVDIGAEYRYSGGIGLLSSDANVVYLSRVVRGRFEVERWETADGGATWTSEPVTRASRDKQVRPTTPEGHYAGCPEVVWMSGWYANYSNGLYVTRLVYRDT